MSQSPLPQMPTADDSGERFPESEAGPAALETEQDGGGASEHLAETADGSEAQSEQREEARGEDEPNPEAELAGGDQELGDEDDLFGEDSDQGDKPEPARSASRTISPVRRRSPSTGSRSDRSERNPLEYEEEDTMDVEEKIVNTHILRLPKRPMIESSDDKAWQLKLPSYIKLDNAPFHPDVFRHQLAQEEAEKPEQPNPKLAQLEAKETMLRVRNTLRWRWVTGADGRPKRESNARMVKWADGTMSLQLGNEIYDVTPSGGASLSSSASAPSSDRHFLCQLFGTERVFLHERAIAGQLTLRPATTNNRTHQERAKAIGQQATKHARLKYHEEAHPNPEKEEKERAEQRAKADKQRKRREAANRPRQRTGAGGSSARTYRKRVRRDSGDEDDEAQFSDDSVFARPSRGKRARSHEVGDYEEDDGFVVADDDDDEPEQEEDEASDDAAYGSKRKSKHSKPKKQSRSKDYDSEPDSMEEAERRIEAQEKEKKRQKKAAAARESSPVKATPVKQSKSKTKSKEYIDDSDDEDAVGEAVDEDEDEDDDDAMEIESEDGD